ncbi:protein TIPIN homolog isoform X2 [Carica papaya]|uniref:protein TIPIN homolog isoform X2 n=1 Tax=Carica papaya TaxID=3649 RepID=UPI000B8C856E|nr:protein TIPIN homolog isoform X2 [Carica papaya]
MDNTKSAPTGCFKCGRPGHWSRDCSSSAPNPSSTNKDNNNYPANATVTGAPKSGIEKPKKVPRTRPKLTPELLLSEDGLGYILRHFPRAFRYRGRGQEVKDLGNLIRLYREWHSHLLPYYSFDQFVHKVEQVAATKRVKNVIKDLRERVARGGDPTKLHEPPREDDAPDDEQGPPNFDELSNQLGNSSKDVDACDLQEAMLNEIYEKAIESCLIFWNSCFKVSLENMLNILENK